MRLSILAILLVVSLAANAYFVVMPAPCTSDEVQELHDRIQNLEQQNAGLTTRIDRNNVSLQSYAVQLEEYRERVNALETQLDQCPAGMVGRAMLQAPAVLQRIKVVGEYPFRREEIVEVGSMVDISVEVAPGRGRVLVQTTPLMGVVFQDAANTAVFVAEERTTGELSGSDTIFSITAEDEIPAVDGSSAGALMTLLVIAAVEDLDLLDNVTLTGTIDSQGNIGEIGGVVEKAEAVQESGKELLLLPAENRDLVTFVEETREYYGFRIIEQRPVRHDAKEYIERELGIRVEYVDTIEDVLAIAVEDEVN